MKIFRIIPSPFHTRQFRDYHKMTSMSYDEQMQLYRKENMVLPGGWAAAMEAEGFQVFEAVYNDYGIQSRWAIENSMGSVIGEPEYVLKILKAQVRKFDPDIIYIYGGAYFMLPSAITRALRHCCSKQIIVTGFWGDELPHNTSYQEHFADSNFVFCSSSIYEQKFKDAAIPCMTIGNCFDNTIRFTPAEEKSYPVVFSGTTGYGFPDHIGRYEKIIKLMRKTDMRIWANEPNLWPIRIKRLLIKVYKQMIRFLTRWPRPMLSVLIRLLPHPRIRRMVHLARLSQESETDIGIILGPAKLAHPQLNYFDKAPSVKSLFPRRVAKLLTNCSDYYNLTTKANIVVNLHRDEDADIGNIRCYEVTGLGSCLLTDRGKELSEFFTPGEDFVAFDTIDECVEKINYLLAHPKEMERIAYNGQRTTLTRHTVKHRCKIIADKLKELAATPATAVRRRRIIQATYDLNHHPISYDIAIFLQAAEVYRKMQQADGIEVNIVWPKDIFKVPGVTQEANQSINADARAYRINNICGQMAALTPSLIRFSHVYTSDRIEPARNNNEIIPFPVKVEHHNVYSRMLMDNPDLITGFSASTEACRYVRTWLDTFLANRKLITITLRQYSYDPERNSNIEAWVDFANRLDPTEYAVVIVPDTDHIEDFKRSRLGVFPHFEPACFNIDLRFALHEQAFLNMFINNGPCCAAMLDKKINYLMFKMVTPSVPHCTEKFLEESGYKVGNDQPYAMPFQHLVWNDDALDFIWREFCDMCNKILASQKALPLGKVA